jgi:hypothetical protein
MAPLPCSRIPDNRWQYDAGVIETICGVRHPANNPGGHGLAQSRLPTCGRGEIGIVERASIGGTERPHDSYFPLEKIYVYSF